MIGDSDTSSHCCCAFPFVAFSLLHFLTLFVGNDGSPVFAGTLSRLGEVGTLAVESTSVSVVLDSLAVELDGASPESRLGSCIGVE